MKFESIGKVSKTITIIIQREPAREVVRFSFELEECTSIWRETIDIENRSASSLFVSTLMFSNYREFVSFANKPTPSKGFLGCDCFGEPGRCGQYGAVQVIILYRKLS